MNDLTYILSRLDGLHPKDQTWVWDVATILHNTKQYTNDTCFELAISALGDTLEPCDACRRSATFPRDHAFDCPLANNDDPAYAAHLILTEDLTDDEHRVNLRHP